MLDNYIVVKLKYILRAEIDGKLKVTLISVCIGVMYTQVNMMFVALL